jgi:uncharacterized protein (TIGR03085 family)
LSSGLLSSGLLSSGLLSSGLLSSGLSSSGTVALFRACRLAGDAPPYHHSVRPPHSGESSGFALAARRDPPREVPGRAGVGPPDPSAYDLPVTYAQDERAALAALLDETGPDGATLCEGWRTQDLAAHLVIREHRPDAAAGVMGGPLAGYTARIQQRYLTMHPYPEIVSIFRNGPPRGLSLFAIPGVDGAANTVEYFVHHEDVRRAADGWTERPLDAGLSDMLWKRLKAARLFLRSAPTGVVLAREPAQSSRALIVAKTAAPSVTVTGSPAELTLWAMGRASAAHVTLDGPAEAVAKLTAWRA